MNGIEKRENKLNFLEQKDGPVIYWMSRDQRVDDNWALFYAQKKAIEMKEGLIVVFCLNEEFFTTSKKQYEFCLKGLKKVDAKLKKLNVPFIIINENPVEGIVSFIAKIKAGCLVTDFSPLKGSRMCKEKIAQKISIEFVEVDAHNIVPCLYASNKQEYAAFTLRPKIHKLTEEFLYNFAQIKAHPFVNCFDIKSLSSFLKETQKIIDEKSNKTVNILSGEEDAKRELKNFLCNKIFYYKDRNDPNKNACSELSAYLNFGQISAQRVANEVLKHTDSAEEFLEELIVRRELSDNYCYFNKNYDNFEGFPKWAKESLQKHRNDPREYLYSLAQLENASTHDDLWNAAQMQMVKTSRMHGFMRMYWAKKILEWSETVDIAMKSAIYLNDKYQLDGRDPNGYTGIAWSIGGVHDRAWKERMIFGKVRYMAYNGCKRKFDIKQYINEVNRL